MVTFSTETPKAKETLQRSFHTTGLVPNLLLAYMGGRTPIYVLQTWILEIQSLEKSRDALDPIHLYLVTIDIASARFYMDHVVNESRVWGWEGYHLRHNHRAAAWLLAASHSRGTRITQALLSLLSRSVYHYNPMAAKATNYRFVVFRLQK